MKKALVLLSAFLLFLLSSCKDTAKDTVPSEQSSIDIMEETSENGGNNVRDIVNYENMKAIWVSQFDMADVYCVDGRQRERLEYERLVNDTVGRIKGLGFNTVILQIRPYGDSFYPSDVYPASRFAVGSYGNGFGYDPISIFVKASHDAGLSVQAWINPLRLMTENEVTLLPPDCVIKKWYVEGKLPCVDGRLYLDPSREEARKLITDGASEALESHGFDGLHIDDYFYPTTDASFDKETYAKNGKTSLDDFRVESINLLVKELYSAVKNVDERLIFGVSPSGNLDTLKAKYYADAEKWCASDGFIDYVMPQVYFGLEHAVCPFAETCLKWRNIIKNPGIRLYIGMTLGKAVNGAKGIEDKYGGSGNREWIEHDDVLKRCFEFLTSSSVADGEAIFCYQYFYDPVSGNKNEYSASEAASFLPYLKDKMA